MIYDIDINHIESINEIGNSIVLISDGVIFSIKENEVKKFYYKLDRRATFIRCDTGLFVKQKSGNYLEISMGKDEALEFSSHSFAPCSYDEKRISIGKYRIESCCNGEWGGSIELLDTDSGETYSVEATCLDNIDLFNDDLFLFN